MPGSSLLKKATLRADEIVHYAYDFAHQYDREYGSPGYGHSFLPQDELRRILTDKAMNTIPNCDKDSAFRVAISAEKILETMGITVKIAVSEESRQMNKEISALDPQRDIGGEISGEESPQNSMAEEQVTPDKPWWHPFGLGMGTEPENVRYGSEEDKHGNVQDPGQYDEEHEAHVREEARDWAQYAEEADNDDDIKPFDPSGNYFCGTCDMRQGTNECMRVEGTISFEAGSCRLYHLGDPENEPPMEKKFSREEAKYEERKEGFGCKRCEYGAEAKAADSEGRQSWCSFWGMHVVPNACCAENEAKDKGELMQLETKESSWKNALLKKAEKPKCPHCGSTEYSLMPTDFETAKCNKCGKNWDHGIVPGINDPSEKTAAKPGSGIHGDEAVNFYKPTQVLPPRYDQRHHIDENMVDNPIVDDLKTDKKKMEGPTPATGHAPLREDLATRRFASEDDEYWLDMVQEHEENAKTHFLNSAEIQQIAQDNGWTMEQAWDELGADFANALYDPRNRLIAHKRATLDANRENPEAFNQFEAIRANMSYLVTGEHWRGLSKHLQDRLKGIYEEMESLGKDWNAAAGVPPEASEYAEPERSEPELPNSI